MSSSVNFEVVDVAAFAREQLPPVPARVLEVGCGDGEVARELASAGYRVLAIDPHAPEGDIFESVSLEEFAGAGPFDAVVANRSLHHIRGLAEALDKLAGLLRDGGTLIVHEHAWDRMDEPTARWYLSRLAAAHPHAPRSLEDLLAKWEADHADLHGYRELRSELDRRFDERFFAWTPYLHGELGGAEAEEEERAMIKSGAIRAIGFCYAGIRSSRASTNDSAG
jgi:SAM-dependent methyltransferase